MSPEDMKAVAVVRRSYATVQIDDALVDEYFLTAVADRAQVSLGQGRGWSC